MQPITQQQQTTLDNLLLLKGQKVTLFGLSEMGFPAMSHTTITEVFLKNYAQYDNMLHIQHKPKGKRKEFLKRVYNYSKLLVYKDHIELESNMYVTEDKCGGTGVTIRQSLTGFSDDYYTRAMNSTKVEPYLIINKD